MSAVNLPPPPTLQPMVDRAGVATNVWAIWLAALFNRVGGTTDKVEAAAQRAAAAVPQSTQVVAAGGLRQGGALTDNVGLTLYAAVCLVADLPTAGVAEGDWAYALDARKPGEAAGAGTGVPAWFSHGAWYGAGGGSPVQA